jgi:hypothetical protein
VSCTHLIKWTNKTHLGKSESLSNCLYAVSRAWTSPSKWPTPEVFINVCKEWEQKKGTSQVIVVAFVQSSSGSCDRFSPPPLLLLFFLANFFYFRTIRSIISSPHTRVPSLLFTSTIYIYVYRIVWSSLVNANRRLIICLSIDVHVISFSSKNRIGGIEEEKTSQWTIV